MAFWNRNKKNDLANEFREYYQPNTNERTGLAWVLALITLVCSVFLIVSLFWGGRWVYRKIADRDKVNTTSQTTTRPSVTPSTSPTATPVPNGPTPTPTPTPTPSAVPTPAAQSGVNGTSTTPTPTPGASLPRTGPDLDL